MNVQSNLISLEEFETELKHLNNLVGIDKVVINAYFSCVHDPKKRLHQFQELQNSITGASILEVMITLSDKNSLERTVLYMTLESLDFTIDYEFNHFMLNLQGYIDELKKMVGDKIISKLPQRFCVVAVKGIEIALGIHAV